MMKKNINVSGVNYLVDVPNECPICHNYQDTQIFVAYKNNSKYQVEVVMQCVFPDCKGFFIAYYPMPEVVGYDSWFYLTPQVPTVKIFNDSVKEISNQFIEIYQQAESARMLGLKDIAGPGFRKAFEFLIKDYAKKLNPDAIKHIESEFSGKVVSEYVPDQRIQAVAKRALWLGNDETHYLKKWEEHDINDLMVLIKLTTDWIDIEFISKKYCEEMPEDKKI